MPQIVKSSPTYSFSKFIDELQGLTSNSRYEYYFRGHSTSVSEILPKIYRKRTYYIKSKSTNRKVKVAVKTGYKSFIKNEDRIFREIILRTPQDFLNEQTAIEKLVKMQHYGLPTRLLDITLNPLVALYFACCHEPQEDGEVVVFKIPRDEVKFYDSDTVSILANVSKMRSDFEVPNSSTRDKFNEDGQVHYLLHEVRSEKPHFLSVINPSDMKKVLAVKVKLNNNRIIRQNGAFLLFGMDTAKQNPAKVNPTWISDIINIPATDKRRLKKDLQSLGIDESSLYPEIEYQSKRLIELYEHTI